MDNFLYEKRKDEGNCGCIVFDTLRILEDGLENLHSGSKGVF
jgi:hypothetical protein